MFASPRVVTSLLMRNLRMTSNESVSNVIGFRKSLRGEPNNNTGFHWSAKLKTNNLGERHTPSGADKKMLVWAKMYKSKEEVPKDVSYAQIRKARDLARIRVNLWMAAATLGACIAIIGYCKYYQNTGDSLQERGLQWERDMKEKGRQERAEAEAKKSS